jgi:hypothetical protein
VHPAGVGVFQMTSLVTFHKKRYCCSFKEKKEAINTGEAVIWQVAFLLSGLLWQELNHFAVKATEE